jgi:hypothetical protein
VWARIQASTITAIKPARIVSQRVENGFGVEFYQIGASILVGAFQPLECLRYVSTGGVNFGEIVGKDITLIAVGLEFAGKCPRLIELSRSGIRDRERR